GCPAGLPGVPDRERGPFIGGHWKSKENAGLRAGAPRGGGVESGAGVVLPQRRLIHGARPRRVVSRLHCQADTSSREAPAEQARPACCTVVLVPGLPWQIVPKRTLRQRTNRMPPGRTIQLLRLHPVA